jgi:hypothetical protein
MFWIMLILFRKALRTSTLSCRAIPLRPIHLSDSLRRWDKSALAWFWQAQSWEPAS